MQGDFSRLTFNPLYNYTQVLWQQGRPLLDCDLNEQASILLHYLRRLTADVIGWHGGPGVVKNQDGSPKEGPFAVKLEEQNKTIVHYNPGRYYVDGWMVEGRPLPASTDDEIKKLPVATMLNENAEVKNRLVFIDVWQRVVPGDADPALGCQPPTLRSELKYKVWVAKVDATDARPFQSQEEFRKKLAGISSTMNLRGLDAAPVLPKLKAWRHTDKKTDPSTCAATASADASSFENRLYRVEIHHGGTVTVTGSGDTKSVEIKDGPLTFKWSRDYNTAVYPANRENGKPNLIVKSDAATKSLTKDMWVELVAEGEDEGVFAKITSVSDSGAERTLTFDANDKNVTTFFTKHTKENTESFSVRRWDHDSSDKESVNGAIVINPGETDENYPDAKPSKKYLLENGVKVQFDLAAKTQFRSGDYWLIPARANGEILWPKDDKKVTEDKEDNDGKNNAKFVPAQYVEHRYAPLALIPTTGSIIDLRKSLDHLRGNPIVSPETPVAASTLRRTLPKPTNGPVPDANEAAALPLTAKKSPRSNAAKKRTSKTRGNLHKAANAAVAKVRLLARVAKHAAKGAPKTAPKTAGKRTQKTAAKRAAIGVPKTAAKKTSPRKNATKPTPRPASKKTARPAKKQTAKLVTSTARRTTKPRKKKR